MNKLVDSFGREHTYLRISVTDRCNLRCVYCMPHEGMEWKPKNQLLTYEEILRVSRVFVSMGINKIRITGGEPLVRKDLEVLIAQLADLNGVHTLAMTTNATLLEPKVQVLHDNGLTALNISLDTFHKDRFEKITRRDDFDRVIAGLNAALKTGFQSVKLNVVVIAGFNDDEIVDFVDFVYDKKLNVRFIEYMPFKDNAWQSDRVVTFADMKELIGRKYKLRPLESERSAVAKDFSIEGGTGTVSFISSMSDSFCSTCNRLRLTADGSIKSCLFYPSEINLRDRLREGATDAEIAEMIMYSLSMKPEAHPPAEEIAAQENRAMIEIGG
jgi:cyclic pyranopterin phosphate synthase